MGGFPKCSHSQGFAGRRGSLSLLFKDPPGQCSSSTSLQGWVTDKEDLGRGQEPPDSPPHPSPPAPPVPPSQSLPRPESRSSALQGSLRAGVAAPPPVLPLSRASAAAAELACRRGGRAPPGAPAPSRGDPGRGGARVSGESSPRASGDWPPQPQP